MNFSGLPVLEHGTVILRPIEASDIDSWYRYLCLPHVLQHTSWEVRSPDELRHHIWNSETFSVSSHLRFAIALKSNSQLVGTAGFHTISAHHRSAELAYDLDPEVWGQGIATTVTKELVRWAHSCASVIRLQAAALESNIPSIKVLERCGFEREGFLQSYRIVRGTPRNFYLYSHVAIVPSAA